MRDNRMFNEVDSFVGRFSVLCMWKGLVDGFDWACTGVYGPNLGSLRGDFWVELGEAKGRWDAPWCSMGDFNVVRYPSERLEGNRFSPEMTAFSDFITELNLVDLSLHGGSFTWSNGSEQPSMSRIDKVLISVDWEEHFPDVIQNPLPRMILDHNPLMVVVGGMARDKS